MVENYTPSLPRVWLLCGHKAGDNAQLLALAQALGWPYEVKRLAYRPYELLVGRFGATLAGIDRRRSDLLVPPWPDLVLTAGRRNEAVALWIQKQAGKPVRIVHVGRPWASLARFDLIVTTPQYRLPARDNVLVNTLPLYDLDRAVLRREAERWRPRLQVPGPFVTVLLGGDSGPYLFDTAAARQLARQVSQLAAAQRASLLVTTSARTSAEAVSAFEAAVTVPMRLHRYGQGDNPYRAFLGLAEAVVVTGDSISMITEACASGRPVFLFPFGYGRWAMRPDAPILPRLPWWHRRRLKAWRSDLALRLAPQRLRRDIRPMHRALIDGGHAAWLGETFRRTPPSLPDELARTAARVKALLA
ncbi:conserved hypothetical protein [Methylomarinovum tepidoasis]|uniref:Nucleoside-diphosphate sugar epimerase n=2 Tax=Methylomarinovum tepidoasis TaxID=2840183 RepID=A0AAU9CBH0_9GAMM|nr:conserved hypothetical protein [Methylomarinovum sp. IN45]